MCHDGEVSRVVSSDDCLAPEFQYAYARKELLIGRTLHKATTHIASFRNDWAEQGYRLLSPTHLEVVAHCSPLSYPSVAPCWQAAVATARNLLQLWRAQEHAHKPCSCLTVSSAQLQGSSTLNAYGSRGLCLAAFSHFFLLCESYRFVSMWRGWQRAKGPLSCGLQQWGTTKLKASTNDDATLAFDRKMFS